LQAGEEVQETNDENQKPPKSNFSISLTQILFAYHVALIMTVVTHVIRYKGKSKSKGLKKTFIVNIQKWK